MVEVLVVLTILAILMAIAAPSFRGESGAKRVNAVMDQMVADINLARIQAIRRGRTGGVIVDADGRGYRVFVDADTLRRQRLEGDHPAVRLTPAGERIGFNSRGMRESLTATTLTATQDAVTAKVQISGIGQIYRGS